MFALEIQGFISLVALVLMLGVKGFAFISALTFAPEAYRAADKANKAVWGIGLGVGFTAQVLLMTSPLSIIHLIFIIAALVYLADVRPALGQVTGRR